MKFGTSGLRGLSTDLVGRASGLYATAFGIYLLQSGMAKKGDMIAMARDFRESSPEIATAAAHALGALDFAVLDCGTVPTPALALYAFTHKIPALMITGSHIPADRNGIKFYRADGEIDKADEAAIVQAARGLEMDGFSFSPPPPIRDVSKDRMAQCISLYLARYAGLAPSDALAGMRIGVYQHSTVARDLVVELLNQYGASVVELGRSTNFIPVDTEAVSRGTIEQFASWARDHKLDAIVSADGDADRPLVADESGNPMRGDLLGSVAAEYVGAKTVVTPVTSSSGLELSEGFSVVRTRVGSPYVISAMHDAIAAGGTNVVGFEANGGFLTATPLRFDHMVIEPLPTRDFFLPVLSILLRASRAGLALSALAKTYHLPCAVSGRLEDFAAERSASLMRYLLETPENLSSFLEPVGSVHSVNMVDGLRVTFRSGQIMHLRPSGNAPEMRCYVEAESESAANKLLKIGLELVHSSDLAHYS